MSSGLNHDKFHRHMILPTSALAGIFACYFGRDLAYGVQVFFVTYLAEQFNRLCTPDTDTDNKSFQDFLTKLLDPYFSKIWYAIWWPYSKIIPHRHWTSHGLIVGGLIRLLYLLICLSPTLFLFNWLNIAISYWDLTIFFILGYCIADIYHLILDFTDLRNFIEYTFK